MGGDKNCHGIELAHWQTSCIAGLTLKYDFFSGTSGYRSRQKILSVHAPDDFLSHAKNRLRISRICGP